eukprot:4288700-Amphidinium_carterae.1
MEFRQMKKEETEEEIVGRDMGVDTAHRGCLFSTSDQECNLWRCMLVFRPVVGAPRIFAVVPATT